MYQVRSEAFPHSGEHLVVPNDSGQGARAVETFFGELLLRQLSFLKAQRVL